MDSLMTSSSSAGPIQISKFPEPWFEGLMNRGTNGFMNKQTNRGEFGYFGLISNIIPNIKSIILLEKYELFKYFNIKVMTQKIKVCFVDLKVMGMGDDNHWHFSYFCFNT